MPVWFFSTSGKRTHGKGNIIKIGKLILSSTEEEILRSTPGVRTSPEVRGSLSSRVKYRSTRESQLNQGSSADDFCITDCQSAGQSGRSSGQTGSHGHKTNWQTSFGTNQCCIQAATILA